MRILPSTFYKKRPGLKVYATLCALCSISSTTFHKKRKDQSQNKQKNNLFSSHLIWAIFKKSCDVAKGKINILYSITEFDLTIEKK